MKNLSGSGVGKLLDYVYGLPVLLQSFEVRRMRTGKWFVSVYFEDDEGTQCDFDAEDEALARAALNVLDQVKEWMEED